LTLTSFATPLILGTKNHIDLNDAKFEAEIMEFEGRLDERNEYSRSEFVIDGTENPHPRFPGLMKSIRERRGEKVKILVPLFKDEKYENGVSSVSSFEN